MCRGVTRLDGAWGKKQVWPPEVVRKEMYCFEKSSYDIVVTIYSPQ